MNTRFLIAAAGMGERLGHTLPKALVPLAGRPLLLHTLDRLRDAGIHEGIVLAPPVFVSSFSELLDDSGVQVIEGGARRQDSVSKGLAAMTDNVDVVAIHDAARPFVSVESVKASVAAALEHGAATVAIPSIDTILESDAQAFLVATPNRSRLWACQTPQTFRLDVIREAHERAAQDNFEGTDDASLVRRMGCPVKLVQGSRNNMKITVPEDLQLAELMLREGLV